MADPRSARNDPPPFDGALSDDAGLGSGFAGLGGHSDGVYKTSARDENGNPTAKGFAGCGSGPSFASLPADLKAAVAALILGTSLDEDATAGYGLFVYLTEDENGDDPPTVGWQEISSSTDIQPYRGLSTVTIPTKEGALADIEIWGAINIESLLGYLAYVGTVPVGSLPNAHVPWHIFAQKPGVEANSAGFGQRLIAPTGAATGTYGYSQFGHTPDVFNGIYFTDVNFDQDDMNITWNDVGPTVMPYLLWTAINNWIAVNKSAFPTGDTVELTLAYLGIDNYDDAKNSLLGDTLSALPGWQGNNGGAHGGGRDDDAALTAYPGLSASDIGYLGSIDIRSSAGDPNLCTVQVYATLPGIRARNAGGTTYSVESVSDPATGTWVSAALDL